MTPQETNNPLPRLLVIYRGLPPDRVVEATERLIGLGFEAFEVSLTTPDAVESIHRLAQTFGGDYMVGAGTVRSVADVDRVCEAGARMILSPVMDPAVIGHAKSRGLVAIPGVYSPTEAAAAVAHGADLVKLFPAGPAGVEYLRLLREPLPDVDFLVTGGVDADMARRFLDAGAVSVGVGHRLLGGESADSDDWDVFRRNAAAYIATATDTRSSR